MKPRTIGILGGAGPFAGLALLDQLFRISMESYDCFKDGDFPKVLFLSFPFSDMLSSQIEAAQVKEELASCLKTLRKNGAEVLAIACNTVHAFLDENENLEDLIHLPREAAAKISSDELPLVLCTSTSSRLGLHRRFFPCVYPDPKVQAQVDRVIERILKGDQVAKELCAILREQKEPSVVLGCTELSLFEKEIQGEGKRIIDPLKIAAIKILEKSFGR